MAVVLLGGAGSGKTETLHRIARGLADSALSGEYGIPTPIFVNLCEFRSDDQPLDYLRKSCGNNELRDRIEGELNSKRLCILCDGLNELPRENYMKKVQTWRRFMERHSGNVFVFACRSSWYQDELHLQKIEISPLDDERIVRTLFIVVGEGANELWETLRRSKSLELARMPLFLQWIVQSYIGSKGRLPRNRSLLLKGLVDSLVKREQEAGTYDKLVSKTVTQVIAEIAYGIQSELSPSA
jgi:predicted NACHT family NTPase